MTPPPPRSTLFPYTTLFRSDAVFRVGLQPEAAADLDPDLGVGVAHGVDAVAGAEAGVAAVGRDPVAAGHRRAQDRKSTRLNSSHVEISYAVFCLKKKMGVCS